MEAYTVKKLNDLIVKSSQEDKIIAPDGINHFLFSIRAKWNELSEFSQEWANKNLAIVKDKTGNCTSVSLM